MDIGRQTILVAGPDTPVPGKGTPFRLLEPPALGISRIPPLGIGPTVAFVGITGGSSSGIYQSDARNTLHVVVDDNSPLPDLTGKFQIFGGLTSSASGNDIAFSAWGTTRAQGIFVAGGGAVGTVARARDHCPSSQCALRSPSQSGNALAFGRDLFSDDVTRDVLYLFSGARVHSVVDTSTAIPHGSGTFASFGAFMLDNPDLAFVGYGPGPPWDQTGVYRTRQGVIERVADRSMIAPGATERFSFFREIAFSHGDIVFSADYGPLLPDGNYAGGLYRSRGGHLEVLVDTNRPSPSGYGNFLWFGQASISASGVAFVGWGPNPNPHAGIYYLDRHGYLATIVDDIHPFFGDHLSNVMDLHPQALQDGYLAIRVHTATGDKIYLIPIYG